MSHDPAELGVELPPGLMRTGAPPAGWGHPAPAPQTTAGKRVAIDEVAGRILEVIVEYFTEAGVELPRRRYVAAGEPRGIAWPGMGDEDGQVTVTCNGVGIGGVEAPQNLLQLGPQVGVIPRHAVFEVMLVRPHPVQSSSQDPRAQPPEPELLDRVGRQQMRDVGVMSGAIIRAASEAGRVVAAGSGVAVGPSEPVGPSGGMVGTAAAFTCTIGELA